MIISGYLKTAPYKHEVVNILYAYSSFNDLNV